ncbi:NudC domain-containing protein 3 [Armadillidium nasatum]|uniref:NudC domain-containing protein 3 n=1 Tax=Armadillidium nasatum TaxID=96803 RepID=A0A5N5SQU3_9CRUS|nr:NudC domain-containing protein 3 [Armadillidium nasatum]
MDKSDNDDVDKYDEILKKIFDEENNSVNKFFDAIFGFFSRNKPELIYDSSKYYGKQVLVSSYEKWQNKYLNSQKTPETSSKSEPHAKDKREVSNFWQSAPPGGPTNTTYTSTVSRRPENHSTSLTKSKNDSDEKPKPLVFDTTNGAKLDKYSWTQSVDDVDLRIPVIQKITKGNQIDKKHLKVEAQLLDSNENEILIEGDLLHDVRVDDCVWLLCPGQHIAILLEKIEEKLWDRCLTHESPIDITKIVAEREFHSLPDEDKIQIEKVIADVQKKERGEPTIAQAKMETILRKAWVADGSPFKDQPFDPSLVQVVSSASTS